MKAMRAGLVAVAGMLLWCSMPAFAHKGSDAYLDVRTTSRTQIAPNAPELQFSLSVAIRDLDSLLPVDANADGQVTWGEIKAISPAVLSTLQTAAQLESGPGGCALRWAEDGLERRSDGVYFRAVAQSTCQDSETLRFRYTLFRGQDATHRLLMTGSFGGDDLLATASPQQAESVVLRTGSGPGTPAAKDTARGPWSTLLGYAALGMHHLLEGYDHLAFLLALVLPLRLYFGRQPGGAASGAGTWWALLRTITAFTVGHSVTLVMASLGWTDASPGWVEPLIALSIAVTAGLNLYPIRGLRTEYLALGFGMVHGFGFAGLLLEAAAPSSLLPWALAGFNVGVEAGQLLAVAAWVALAQPLVRQPWYESAVVRGGSVLLIFLALAWFVQRVV